MLEHAVGQMEQDDQSYYRRRLFEEEMAIRSTDCAVARKRHEELAAAYRIRLQFSLLGDRLPDVRGESSTATD